MTNACASDPTPLRCLPNKSHQDDSAIAAPSLRLTASQLTRIRMFSSVRIVRASRNGPLRVPPRASGITAVGPCLACAHSSSRRTLCSSSSRRQGRGPLYGNNDKRAEHVKGTWERPSDFQRPRQQTSEPWPYRSAPGDGSGPPPPPPRRTAREAASSPESKAAVGLVVLAAVAFYVWNSQTVPLTGRSRFNFLSDEVAEWMHPRAVQSILNQIHEQGGTVLPDDNIRTRIVKNVMRRLIPVSGLSHLQWEIYVIADDTQANAFVLPGGKVFVFSGLLNMAGNDDALAAVLGHEIAHQTASHTAERLSLAWVGNFTTGALFFLVGALPGLALFGIWTATGAFVIPELMYELPMSRTHEYEADHIGLMMMAEACYDPRAAIPFWQRMSQQGHEVDEMLSTHPSNDHRVAKLAKLMPEALTKREQSDCRGTESFARRFRLAVKQKQPEMPRPDRLS